MGAARFFIGLRGRLDLGDFWLGAAALMALAWLATVAAWRFGLPKPIASIAGDGVMLAGAIGLCVQRGNDRGHKPAETLAALNLVAASAAGLALAAAHGWPRIVTVLLVAATVTVVVMLLVDLGLMGGAEAEAAAAEAPVPEPLAEPAALTLPAPTG